MRQSVGVSWRRTSGRRGRGHATARVHADHRSCGAIARHTERVQLAVAPARVCSRVAALRHANALPLRAARSVEQGCPCGALCHRKPRGFTSARHDEWCRHRYVHQQKPERRAPHPTSNFNSSRYSREPNRERERLHFGAQFCFRFYWAQLSSSLFSLSVSPWEPLSVHLPLLRHLIHLSLICA